MAKAALSVLPAEAAKGEAERKGWNDAIDAAAGFIDGYTDAMPAYFDKCKVGIEGIKTAIRALKKEA